MSNKNNGGPAFPWCGDLNECPTINLGMTLRQYAAIKLRAPESGDEWLDDMIRKSLRDEMAAKAMQASRSRGSAYESWEDLASDAYEIADAMLKERDK